MFAGLVTVSQEFTWLPLLVCAAYYALLLVSLRGCAEVGGRVARFYRLAIFAVTLHLVPALLILTGLSRSQPVQAAALVSAYGVYAFCSLAGAETGRQKGMPFMALIQVFWPVLFFAPVLDPRAIVISFTAFAIQGLQALLLALSPEKPVWEYVERASEIGWDSP